MQGQAITHEYEKLGRRCGIMRIELTLISDIVIGPSICVRESVLSALELNESTNEFWIASTSAEERGLSIMCFIRPDGWTIGAGFGTARSVWHFLLMQIVTKSSVIAIALIIDQVNPGTPSRISVCDALCPKIPTR